jgi:ketosteroid isomerase-like protein
MEIKPNYPELTLSVFNSMNKRDFTELEKNVVENVAFDFPGAGRIEGAKRVILFLKALLRKYPKLNFVVKEVLIENDKACAVWTNAGESSDGKPYANSGITLLHFEGGKIVFISDYFKDTSFVKSA